MGDGNSTFSNKGRARKIVHIVPGLVPGECGLGDYAVKLAREFEKSSIRGGFVVAGRELRHRSSEYDSRGAFPITVVDDDRPSSLVNALRSEDCDLVILHYSGYGYHRGGYPRWLREAIEAYRQLGAAKVVTFFHETWQSPKLFSRRLYLSFLQKSVAKALCASSDYIVTNTELRAKSLGKFHQHGCKAMPVFSNVGEKLDSKHKEKGLGVIFGLPRKRAEAWKYIESNTELLNKLGVVKLIDIGTANFSVSETLRPLIEFKGRLEEEEVSAILSRAEFGFIFYDASELGKSGVFNAYAAHRMCVVNLGENGEGGGDNLKKGVHFYQAQELVQHDGAVMESERVADNLAEWYIPHGVYANSRLFLTIFEEQV